MPKVICAFIFDHLDAEYITSSAYTDNPASLGVSRKCGYQEDGVTILKRDDKPATLQQLILEPGNLVRYEHSLTVEGVPEFRRSIGLDASKTLSIKIKELSNGPLLRVSGPLAKFASALDDKRGPLVIE